MLKEEVKKKLIQSIKENNGKTPMKLMLDKEYVYCGGRTFQDSTLYRYRTQESDYKEISIMLRG